MTIRGHRWLLQRVIQIASNSPFLIGLSIRLVLMVLLPWLLDESAVKYTDIDYHVFTDAATYIQRGESPYKRHTYRYTPYLAWILSFATTNKPTRNIHSTHSLGSNLYFILVDGWRHPRYFGRLIFCVSDALCGLLILDQRQASRTENQEKKVLPSSSSYDETLVKFLDAACWLYNPLAINICTRGSAESFIVLLPVLSSLVLALNVSRSTATNRVSKRRKLWTCAMISGILHGLAVHTKLYPIIYTVSFMAFFSFQEQPFVSWDSNRYSRWSVGFCFIQVWSTRLLLRFSSILFLLSFLGTFLLLTMKSIQQYGMVAFQEGLLYHFSRIDHRHNYSIYWYWFYLSKARFTTHAPISAMMTNYDDKWIQGVFLHGQNLLLSLPQLVLILISSLGIAPYDLSLALFIQTFLFVAQNKVITAQYFTWYLCLLPLCSQNIQLDGKSFATMIMACIGLLVSMCHWLIVAFYVEMMGKSLHLYLWVASLLFYFAQIVLGTLIIRSCDTSGFKRKRATPEFPSFCHIRD